MIIGSGIDIIEVNRIQRNLENTNFMSKIYTNKEIVYINSKKMNSQTAAGIFAAKEAVSKCLGTGISGFSWRDIEIVKDDSGKPYVILYNNALKIARDKKIKTIHISITHVKDIAVSLAIAENEGEYIKANYNCNENYYSIKKALSYIKHREKDTHKGTYGKVAVIAGSRGMTGAAYLSCMSALRMGSGLVYSIIPERLENILSIKLTEAVIKPINDNNLGYFINDNVKDILDIVKKCDVVLLGPGIGTDIKTKNLVYELIRKISKPLVMDADALNCISDKVEILSERCNETVITPHMGEMSRLLGIKDITNKNKVIHSREFSYKYNVVTVLKGYNTVTSSPYGKHYINPTGNPGMATAGSGDVLAGIIVSLIGQGIDCFNAASCGTFIHGLAGDLAASKKGEHSLIARDIINNIPLAIKYILKNEGFIEN